MGEAMYRKTPLPVRLNLSDRNTREQLKSKCDDSVNSRGVLEGAGLAAPVVTSRQGCTDVMREHLRSWLAEHGISGPPPSPEAEQRAMWQWMREFHKEYNDDWFTRNMPRLHEQFRPVFVEIMKQMKAEVAAVKQSKGGLPESTGDLLDFTAPVSSANGGASHERSGGNVDDLLSLDEPSSPVAVASSALASQSAQSESREAASACQRADADLLSFDASSSPVALSVPATFNSAAPTGLMDSLLEVDPALPTLQGTVAASNAAAKAAPAANSGLLDFDLSSFSNSSGQAVTKTVRQTDNLLDLVF